MIQAFLISAVSFAVLDFFWLGYVMMDFNVRQLSEIGRIENGRFAVQYWAAGLAYILMALSVAVFVLPRAEGSMVQVFLTGALMGLIVFGIFDFTNLAILKHYPIPFVVADIAWGTFVYGVVTVISKKLVG